MKSLFYALALILLFVSAAEASAFTCTEGFTLSRETGGWRLKGMLETPTPGYKWDIGEPTSRRMELIQAPLTLTAPDGDAAMMIDRVHVDHFFSADDNLLRLTLSIRKEFDWGPDVIDCAIMVEKEQ